MTTVHEMSAEHLLGEVLKDAGAAAVFAETRQRFAVGDFDDAHVAAIGQIFRATPKTWPLSQVASYLHIHTGIGAGIYAEVEIEVGASPSADRERERNASALADLPEPFVATVDLDQNCGDQDGFLKWGAAIRVQVSTGLKVFTGRSDWPDILRMGQSVKPRQAPLEIGYTLPSRTAMHLYRDGAVARWPYDAESIHLLIDVRPPSQRGLGL